MKYAPEFKCLNFDIMDTYKTKLELNNLKQSTINTKLWKVYTFLDFYENLDLNTVTKKDVEKYIVHRRKNKKSKTVHNDIIDLRLFFKWLKPNNDFFSDIKDNKDKRRLPTKNLIIPKDIKKILSVCKGQRDRALVSLMYDSGARLSEVLGLNVGDVIIDQYGATITVDGKTGMRRIRLVNATPEVQSWLNQHPNRDDEKAPLFTTLRKKEGEFKRIKDRTVQNLLTNLAEEAEIKKTVHPHALRHGRLTELVKKGMREMELRIFAGWEPGSEMPATYLHISGDDVDDRILSIHGIVKEDEDVKKDDLLKPKECPRCKYMNPSDAKYCSNCSLILDDMEAMNIKRYNENITNLMAAIMNDEKARNIYSEMINKK